jgi:hypothetical protein
MCQEYLEVSQVICVENVDITRNSTIWIAAFQMYAAFGSRKGGLNASAVCGHYHEQGDFTRARAWDAVCGAIREFRYCMFVN